MRRQRKWLLWPLIGLAIVVSLAALLLVTWHASNGKHPEAGSLFEGTTALAAWTAIVVAILQILASNKSQKRATAVDIYRGYLTLAIEHPDESRYDKKGKDCTDPEKYDAFVTYLLFAAEEVLNLVPEDKQWSHALKLDLGHHKEFLRSQSYRDDTRSYTKRLQKLVTEVLNEDQK